LPIFLTHDSSVIREAAKVRLDSLAEVSS